MEFYLIYGEFIFLGKRISNATLNNHLSTQFFLIDVYKRQSSWCIVLYTASHLCSCFTGSSFLSELLLPEDELSLSGLEAFPLALELLLDPLSGLFVEIESRCV